MNILVLGGGYTGLATATRVARKTRKHGGRVTLVNPSPRFVERLRLHQIATGQELADLEIPELIKGTGIEFVQGRVAAINAAAHRVHLADGGELTYDTLVYAMGAAADTGTVAGVNEHAYTLNGFDEAKRLAGALTTARHVVVAGGGLTGIESAAEIAENFPGVHVTLVSREVPGAMMGEKARRYLHRSLAELGVEMCVGESVAKVLPDAVELDSGKFVDADACLWTAGVRVPPMAAEAGLAVDDHGRIVVDETLRSVSHPDVYAVGDAAAITQKYGIIHGTCQSGIPTGSHAADSIARRLRGKKAKPFRFGYIHQPVSIGRRNAVIQFTRPDDTPRRFYLKGWWAIRYKEFVSSSPWPSFKLTKLYAGAVLWPHGGRATR